MSRQVNNRTTGAEYEEQASRWLTEQGVEILKQNFRCKQGEIDLIGRHQGYLVFIEVKYRKSNKHGYPEEAVGIAKQRKICMTGDYYRISHQQFLDMPVRYDVIAVSGTDIRWHQNAFMHTSIYENTGKYYGSKW